MEDYKGSYRGVSVTKDTRDIVVMVEPRVDI